MYGTVVRLLVRPGKEAELLEELSRENYKDVPGYGGIGVYRMTADPNEFWAAVAFETKEAYEANAESPEQAERYRKMRDLLVADPEWHDGEVVYATEGP